MERYERHVHILPLPLESRGTLLRYAKRRPFKEIRTFIALAEHFLVP